MKKKEKDDEIEFEVDDKKEAKKAMIIMILKKKGMKDAKR